MTTSRRTIVRGVAWLAPVVTIAATAPAYAASLFECSKSKWCKTQNAQNGDRWDFKFWPTCTNGVIAKVFINGVQATYVAAAGRTPAYYVLRRQPHSYTFSVKVLDTFGRVGFDRNVDVRESSCAG